MGFRFRKSINVGKGFRINLSKSGIGYSMGTKGFRKTKMANGRTRNTFSIPGTGVSYVDEKGKSKSSITQNVTNFDNYDFSNDEFKNNKESIMKKILKGIVAFFIFIISLAYFPILLVLGSIAIIIYYATHRQSFFEKSLIKKLGTVVLLLFLILFGAAGMSVENEKDLNESTENGNSNIQSFASILDTLQESNPTDEAPDAEHFIEEPEIEKPIITEEPKIEESSAISQPTTEEPTIEESTNQQVPAVIVAPIITNEENSPTAEIPENAIQPEKTPVQEEAPIVETPTTEDIKVFITETGSKYHRAGCRHLKDSKFETTLKKATSQGYGACGTCKPPTQ